MCSLLEEMQDEVKPAGTLGIRAQRGSICQQEPHIFGSFPLMLLLLLFLLLRLLLLFLLLLLLLIFFSAAGLTLLMLLL